MPRVHDSLVQLQRRRQAHERPQSPAAPLAWCKQWLPDEAQHWKPWKLSSPWSPNRSPSTSTETRTIASGRPDEWREGRTRAAKRLWDVVRRLWELVRLYTHMGSTPAPNSYCTPTWLSAKKIGLDQCCAVLTFVRTSRFRFLHYVMRTRSFFLYI